MSTQAHGRQTTALGRFFALVWMSVRGDGGDPTQGPVGRAILLLAVPMVLEMLMESVFAVVDIFFVARLGADAVAAVGITESLIALVYTVSAGLSIGVAAVVARRIGEGNSDAAAEAAFQALLLGAVLAAGIGVAGFTRADDLLALMGASPEVIAIGGGYARIALGSNVVILLLFLLNAAFRGAGDAAIAMRVLWIANGINLVLDPLLIFGIGPFPELGVTGAAVATSIGRGAGVLVQLAVLLGGSGRLRLAARHLVVRVPLMLRVLRLSGMGTLQVLVGTLSWIGLTRILADLGSEAVAGYTIAIRVVLFALMPAWGLANAAATMVGQSLGARDPERAERAVWLAGRLNLGFLGSVGLVFFVAAPTIVGWFGDDAAAAAFAVDGLRILSCGFLMYAYGMVLTQSFNGAGDTTTPMLLNIVCFWLWEIPLAWTLAHPVRLGASGVFIAVSVAFSTLAVASLVLFRRGRWKTSVV